MAVAKVTDPLKIVTDELVLKQLAEQGIDPEYVEFYQDYAMPAIVNGVKEKGKSPYAKFYHDRISGKRFMVSSGLPMVDADGNKNVAGWDDNGSLKNPRYTEKNNLFKSRIDGTKVVIQVKNDQPDGRKQGDKLTYQAQLFLDDLEVLPARTDATRLPVDPTNPNYTNNVLEWDYGICKRRLRLIEGHVLGSWVFASKPNGIIRIKYNQYGDYRLRLGQFKVGDDEELVKPSDFDELAKLQLGYPVIVSDESTFYPDADTETSSVDGTAYRNHATTTWNDIVTGAGTGARPSEANNLLVYISSSSTSNQWDYNFRGIFLFDTSPLPDSAEISSAVLSIYGTYKGDEEGTWAPNVNIYSSNPAGNTNIVNADYGVLGSAAFSTAITYAAWNTSGYNAFTLNESGLAAISKTSVSKYGTRNTTYDVGNSAPSPWSSGKDARLDCYFAEQGAGFKPKLVITYTEPVTHEGAATLSGTGTLVGIGVGTFIGKSILSGAGTLAAIGSFWQYGVAALSGTGTLVAKGVGTFVGTVILSGTGNLSAIGRRIFTGVATLAGVGSLSTIGRLTAIGKAALGGVGSLTSNGVITSIGKATLAGVGTLATVGRRIFTGAATLSGVGTLASIGRLIATGKATLTGVATLSGIGHITAIGKATLSGIGTLIVAGTTTTTHYGVVLLSGIGTLGAIGRGIFTGSSTLTGTGSLAAIGRGIFTGSAIISGVGTLTTIGRRLYQGAVSLSGIGSLITAGHGIFTGITTFSGAGTLACKSILTLIGKATLDGTGSLSANGRRLYAGSVTFIGTGILATQGNLIAVGKAAMSGAGTLTAILTKVSIQYGSVLFSGIGTLIAKAFSTFGKRRYGNNFPNESSIITTKPSGSGRYG